MEAQQKSTPLPLRSHTILGVCEAIGEDFGFNPNYLRIPLAASVLYSPMWAAIGYFALGLVVLVSRLVFPTRKQTEVKAQPEAVPANEQRELAKAA